MRLNHLQVFLCDIFNASFASFYKIDDAAVSFGGEMQAHSKGDVRGGSSSYTM